MSWEVQIMQSKTSCFSKTLFRKNLTRFCPLWLIYLGIWVIALPFNLLQCYSYYPPNGWDLQRDLLNIGLQFGGVMAFGYGVVCALAVFSYLFSARSANTLHALPFRREELFLTNFLSGLAFAVLPNLIILVATFIIEAFIGVIMLQATFQWFLLVTLAFLFFYGFAVFLVQLTGNGFFLIAIYGILNFTVIGVEGVIRFLQSLFLYGYYSASSFGTSGKFSPIYYLLAETNVEGQNRLYNTLDELVHMEYVYNGWIYLGVIAAVGLLFAGTAFLLYRRRNIESAGDVIAIRCLRPVFKYCFAVGFSLIFGVLLYSFVQQVKEPVELFAQIACFMLIGAFFGYFVAEILMQKSFRVFRRSWKGFVMISVCIVALLAALDYDLFGYETYIPAADEIDNVVINYIEGDRGADDEEMILRVLALHEQIIAEKENQEALQVESERFYYGEPVSDKVIHGHSCKLTYNLKNGETVTRQYHLAYEFWDGQNDLENADSLISNFAEIYNDPIFILLRFVPDMEVNETKDIQYCKIDYLPVDAERTEESSGYAYYGLSSEEAYALFTTCILPDLQEGLMGYSYFSENETYSKEQYAVSIEICFNEWDKDYSGEWVSASPVYVYTPTIYSVRTMEFLKNLGIEAMTSYEEQQFYNAYIEK